MPIDYQVIPNALTSPPSYTGRVVPKNVLNIDDVAYYINIHNPTITAKIAKNVIEAFRDEVLFQLGEGNTINIASFCSFASSLPFRVDSATDTLPPNIVDIKAKPSAPFKTQLKQNSNFNRLPYTEKSPNVSEALDTNSGVANWARDNFGFRINGSDIGFDQTNSTLGVWVKLADGTEVKQSNLGLNQPSSIIIVPSFEASLPAADDVEVTLVLKNEYTENGQIRTGTYENKVRATNASTGLFNTGIAIPPVTKGVFTGTNQTARLVAQILPNGTLSVSAGSLTGDLGQSFDILETTTDVTLNFDGNTLALTIDDYAVLRANVLAYQRYMQEVAPLSTIP